jgi:hypothetical protein
MKQLQTLLATLCLAACGAESALPPIDCPEGTERTRSGTCIPLDGADALGDDTATGGDNATTDSGGPADTGIADTGVSDTASGGDTSADTGVPPCSAAGLAINEIYPNPDGTDGDREFVEISGPPSDCTRMPSTSFVSKSDSGRQPRAYRICETLSRRRLRMTASDCTSVAVASAVAVDVADGIGEVA